VLGVEVVNLIWRHLATPDALPWAWGMLRPLYADGTIRAEAHGALAYAVRCRHTSGLYSDHRRRLRRAFQG
jgi:hypothetical protein